MNLEVGVIQTEAKNSIQVNIKEWKGSTYVDIRTYYKGSNEVWFPTPKGVFIPIVAFSQLISLLEKAECELAKVKQTA